MPERAKPTIARLAGGANQARVRAHNERLVLSLVRRQAGLSKAEIARQTGLSAQTVTVIMRALEEEGLLLRGQPRRGKVGQPSVPMFLDPDGAYSFGLKIGRRSADLILLDFTGEIRGSLRETYPYPEPDAITAFVGQGVENLRTRIQADRRNRIAGLGVAMPYELWNWAEQLAVPAEALAAWRGFDVAAAMEVATGLPTLIQNDGTAACGAELLFGRGREHGTFAYIFMGYFAGGGVVIDNKLITGPSGNAGAIGTLRVAGTGGRPATLLDCASLNVLEETVRANGGTRNQLWTNPDSWERYESIVRDWTEKSASYLGQAILTMCSVIDFEAIVFDGNLPPQVRAALVAAVDRALDTDDLSGITRPAVLEGSLGQKAQVLGGAALPIMARYLIDNAVLFKTPVP